METGTSSQLGRTCIYICVGTLPGTFFLAHVCTFYTHTYTYKHIHAHIFMQQMLDEVKKEVFTLKEENAALRVQKHGMYSCVYAYMLCHICVHVLLVV